MHSKPRKCSNCQSPNIVYAEISHLLTCGMCVAHRLCWLPLPPTIFKAQHVFLTIQEAVWFPLISLQEMSTFFFVKVMLLSLKNWTILENFVCSAFKETAERHPFLIQEQTSLFVQFMFPFCHLDFIFQQHGS